MTMKKMTMRMMRITRTMKTTKTITKTRKKLQKPKVAGKWPNLMPMLKSQMIDKT